MFAAYCPTCSRRELVSPSQVLAVGNGDDGIAVAYRCSRGHLAQWTTGRRAQDPHALAG